MRVALGLLAALSLAAATWLGVRVDRERPRGARAHVLYLPSSAYLKHTSLGFQSLVADSLYMWGIQYATDRTLKGQMENLPKLFDVVTDLDSRFDDAYFTGAFLIATDGRSVVKALELLDKGYRVRKGYMFPYDAGFYCFLYKKDYALAESYFRRAAETEGCPLYVRRLALKMGVKQNPRAYYDAYREELATFVATHTPEEVAKDVQSSRHVRLLRARIRELEVALETDELERMRAALGAPGSIQELRQRAAAAGVGPALLARGNDPWSDPYGEPYVMSAGKIQSSAGPMARGNS